MIQKKYKLSDFVKDMNLSAQEVTDLLQKVDATPKKPTATMSEEELDLAFEHFTKANSVESFDDYFALLKEKPAKAVKEEPKAVEADKISKVKTEDKKADLPQTAQPARTQAQQGQSGQRPQTQQGQSGQRPQTQQGQSGQRPQTQQGQSGQRPQTQQGQSGQRPQAQQGQSGQRPQTQQGQGGQRPQTQQGQGGQRPQTQQGQGGQRPQAQQGQSGQQNQQTARPVTPINPNRNKSASQNPDFYANNNARAPKQVQRPTGSAPRPQQSSFGGASQQPVQGRVETTTDENNNVRHVDTRTVEVNLDKYNERYEQIAPGQAIGRNDSYQKKQKLNQKSQQRAKQKFSNKKETETQKLQRMALERARKQQLKVLIPDEITVAELASRLKATATDVIKRLMLLGVMASQTEVIDFDTAALVADEMGAKVEKEVIVTVEERLIDDSADEDATLETRSPVVVVMGHVDHGKTSLLDKIRDADVTSTEAGGITQHIGAYTVSVNEKSITFLDTPGHEAFTSMRARGASITDIAILVVAADDGIMPQTVEAINHAKAAGVSIIVAINKMDKPHANPDKVMQELTEYELVPEAWGGDVICCPVSALTGEGIPQLLEYVALVADMADLRANPNRLAKGTVIEARLDKGRGPVATLLVQNGTLKSGDIIIAGASVGRVRVMTNDKGVALEEAGPSTPVEITGLAEVPSAGDVFNAVEDERLARTLVDQRKYDQKEEIFKQYQKVTLDNLFNSIAQGEVKELPIIVKADVQGSAEAVKQSLEKLTNEEVRVRVIHNGVGAVNKSDVMLAQASGAIIIGFNVRPDQNVRDSAEDDDVEIRLYRIIYDAIEDVKQAMKGMLDPKTREVELGRAEVRQVYKITNVGVVAGCYVREGKVARNALIRVVRDGIVLAEDKIDSLKRFKDDQKEVATGYECGIGLDKFNDVKEGDIFESFIIEEYRD